MALDVATETPAALVALRRDLHRHPELRFEEHRTAALIEAWLRDHGCEIRSGIAGTGVLGHLDGSAPGPHVVVRADMDAMPVIDLKDVPYASVTKGRAHACGHDVHVAVALGVADRLATSGVGRGRVSFIFQPAEERPFGAPSGAQAMLDAGVFADRLPDVVLGFHCWPDLPVGTIGVDERVAMSAKDAFRLVLTGAGAHAATPSQGRDAIAGLAAFVSALYAGFARSIDPGELAAVNVGTIAGGASQSVVAERAEATGTLRTIEPDVRRRLHDLLERIAAGSAATFGLRSDLTWADEMPAIINDPRLVDVALAVANEVLGPANARLLTKPPMTVDDFALFAQHAPALYAKLGVCGEAPCPPLHSGSFDVDDRAIGIGVAFLTRLTERLLADPAEERRA